MIIKKIDKLDVPGANLYYEVCGSGPILLMIHGGNGDANVFYAVVDKLAEHFMVVTYDRRGHSRSKISNSNEEYLVETHSDDAHRLLSVLTSEPAYVFGSSSGAVIGLDLAIRHPEQVRILIPHEPPLPQLLPERKREQALKIMKDLEADYLSMGAEKALGKFTSTLGMGDFSDHGHQVSREQREQMVSNIKYFVTKEAAGIRRYIFDIDALKNALKVRVIPGGGQASKDYFPYQCADALANCLGVGIVDFPGNHAGYVFPQNGFAEQLCSILDIEKNQGGR